jgi:DnaJ homolog subfamily C member 19
VNLVAFLLVAVLICRLVTGRWPWQFGRRIAAPREAQARALLGVSPTASHAEIIEAHKRLVALVHPDRGGTNEQVHEANAARDLLLGALQQRPEG